MSDVHQVSAETEIAFLKAVLDVFEYLEPKGLLRVMMGHGARWCGSGYGFGLGLSEDRRSFIPMASTLEERDPRYRAMNRLGREALSSCLSSAPQVFPGLGPLDKFLSRWPGSAPTCTVVVPVLATSGDWLGVLLLMDGDSPDERRTEQLARLQESVRPAVDHVFEILMMRELVIRDDTAHCFNRRYFEEFLPEELSRAGRFRAPLSLIFLDMDNLKEVNNAHGHAMGSRTLLEVSLRVRSKIRKFDKLFRFGGDEFCILLPETEWHGAMEVAERVREAIASKPFLMRELGESAVNMTASLGIASYPLHARSQQDLVRQSDLAMQRVKGGTKNSIGVAELMGDGDG